MQEAELSPEDQDILDALTDPPDREAFRNIIDNARSQGKTGAELVREDPAHTSRKAIRKLCLNDRWGFLSALFRSVFGGYAKRHQTTRDTGLDFMKPPPQ